MVIKAVKLTSQILHHSLSQSSGERTMATGHCRAFAGNRPCDCEFFSEPADPDQARLCQECGHGYSRHVHLGPDPDPTVPSVNTPRFLPGSLAANSAPALSTSVAMMDGIRTVKSIFNEHRTKFGASTPSAKSVASPSFAAAHREASSGFRPSERASVSAPPRKVL